MSIADKNLKELQKKITQLEDKIEKNSVHAYAFLTALLEALVDRGLIKPDEFNAYLDKHTQHYKRLAGETEFLKLIKQIKKD